MHVTCYMLHLPCYILSLLAQSFGSSGRPDDGRCFGVLADVLVLGLGAARSLPFPREHLAALCWANGEHPKEGPRRLAEVCEVMFTRILTRVLHSHRGLGMHGVGAEEGSLADPVELIYVKGRFLMTLRTSS